MNSTACSKKTDSFFKKCPKCGKEWRSMEHFLNDSNVTIIGYQANFTSLKDGLFLFNHSCQTTFSIRVDAFQNLFNGPIYQKRATSTNECPGYCLHQEILESCEVECECAYVREILKIIRKQNRIKPA